MPIRPCGELQSNLGSMGKPLIRVDIWGPKLVTRMTSYTYVLYIYLYIYPGLTKTEGIKGIIPLGIYDTHQQCLVGLDLYLLNQISIHRPIV